MKNIVIFSGTTEGRLLAESFAAAEVPVTVCVATEYGEEVMEPDPFIRIHKGRMDAEEMVGFLHDADVVFDATHPYAVEVTENIREACKKDNIRYERIERQIPAGSHDGHTVTHVKNTAEAVQRLKCLAGNIFLTTGSKELKDFSDVKERLYVRVLPSREAIGICENLGIEKSHIIAQQGPFTYDENLALIRRYDIGVLVTKNSGKNGGYDEKVKAAETAGIPVITIERPQTAVTHPKKKTVSLIGAGCGEDTLTIEAVRRVRQADLIIGTSERLLDYDIVKKNPCPKFRTYRNDEIVQMVSDADGQVAVLFSGDTGFFSGAGGVLNALPDDMEVKVYPGISSIAVLSARIGIPYDHAVIKSYHGVELDEAELKHTVAENQVTFLLLSGRSDAEEICRMFADKRVFIAKDLGTDHEWVGEKRDGSIFRLSGSLYTVAIV